MKNEVGVRQKVICSILEQRDCNDSLTDPDPGSPEWYKRKVGPSFHFTFTPVRERTFFKIKRNGKINTRTFLCRVSHVNIMV